MCDSHPVGSFRKDSRSLTDFAWHQIRQQSLGKQPWRSMDRPRGNASSSKKTRPLKAHHPAGRPPDRKRNRTTMTSLCSRSVDWTLLKLTRSLYASLLVRKRQQINRASHLPTTAFADAITESYCFLRRTRWRCRRQAGVSAVVERPGGRRFWS